MKRDKLYISTISTDAVRVAQEYGFALDIAEYAKSAFQRSDEDVFTYTNEEIDFSKRCIYKIEEFT